jgi:hypothetical protein
LLEVILPPLATINAPVEWTLELNAPIDVPERLPVNVPLLELVIDAPPEVPVPPRKERRSPGNELLFVLVIVIVGFVLVPVRPAPLKVSDSLLKLKRKIDALEGKLNVETEKGAELMVGLVSIFEMALLKIASSLLPGIVLGFQLAVSFMLLFGL